MHQRDDVGSLGVFDMVFIGADSSHSFLLMQNIVEQLLHCL